ncbi:MAG: Cytochrome c oxidase subunit 6A, mitochondrial [Watsoniomyces obsoletus]|nr:MAG: Cytochrome c oxidase subunit 6A, mitochondrial [Watsoniomyces obsoletus]
MRFFDSIDPDHPQDFELSQYSQRLKKVLADRQKQKEANQKKQDELMESKGERTEQRSSEVSEERARHKEARELSERARDAEVLYERGNPSMTSKRDFSMPRLRRWWQWLTSK